MHPDGIEQTVFRAGVDLDGREDADEFAPNRGTLLRSNKNEMEAAPRPQETIRSRRIPMQTSAEVLEKSCWKDSTENEAKETLPQRNVLGLSPVVKRCVRKGESVAEDFEDDEMLVLGESTTDVQNVIFLATMKDTVNEKHL